MDYTTVEYLEEITKKKRLKHRLIHFFHEIKIIVFLFIIVSLGITVFTNADLFISNVKISVLPEAKAEKPLTEHTIYQDNSIASVIDSTDQKNDEINAMIAQYKQSWIQPISLAEPTEQVLENKLQNYDFKFNTLPPTNRLIVPSLGVNDPIVTSKYVTERDFTNGNFYKELQNWPVKYPTTPDPGQGGNTLIFWHTSEERWKDNPFSMAFAHIAEMKQWDMIQVVRNGTLYEYKVVDIQVKYPQHVNETYMLYEWLDKSYLTLMGCYPIGTDKQRILVIAELVDK